jgi:hypothetical protein
VRFVRFVRFMRFVRFVKFKRFKRFNEFKRLGCFVCRCEIGAGFLTGDMTEVQKV